MESPVFRRYSYLPRLVELVAVFIARLLYRVQVRGAERVPETGGMLLLANHLSYADPVVLQLACPRRLHFVGYAGLKENWFMNLVFKWSGTIPISPRSAVESTRRIVRLLEAGEAVCLFPEGEISRTGQLMQIKRGFELMAKKAGVPVVPVAHDGLWGSVFSFSGNKYLFKAPRVMPTPVCVSFGEAIPAAEATAARVRRDLLDLGYEAFMERPVLKRHLGREVVRSLAKRPWSTQVIDRTSERREVSAGKLLGAAAALSRRLRKTVPGKRVGIVLPPGAGAFIANVAVVCAGKVPVNLNFTAGKAAIESSLRAAEIDTVLTADVVKVKLPAFPWPEKSLDLRKEILAAGKVSVLLWTIAAWVLPNQLVPVLLGIPSKGDNEEAGLLFTSGSSGDPKGVVLSHRNILANCWQISSLSILPNTAILMGCLPVFHSFGFTVTLWYPLLRGCHLVTVPSPLDTRKIVDAIRDEGVTVMIGAPTFLRPILKRAETWELRSLELLVSGAEKMPRDLYDAFTERFHIEIMQGYGLTETTPVANVNQHHPPVITETGSHQDGKRLGSVGRMMPGVTARIVDPDTFAEKPQTETGMLLFRGPNVFGGYLKDAEKTAAAFRDGWFVTGDLARFDEDGFLFIEGRLSRFSKIGGEMVPHGTVENAIASAFDWDSAEIQAVVVGVPDAAKGEALVLLTTQDVTLEQLREKLQAAGLAALWIPKTIKRVEAIPMLGTGKVDLKGCRQAAMEA
ncbi:AMP-dependent synthetase [Nibricoccus aquaticus]|uniref:AMP-dependent synthetase n=1 Tax=Nibricoccus aquaticus TaxID=2576891 RepID=A0A290QDK3_9BACT|nr:AMP-binding protein [Nibricoccus aquaticus]ATC65300.1 AMP-dependent synthetase [Nibricoccus aquaticus]